MYHLSSEKSKPSTTTEKPKSDSASTTSATTAAKSDTEKDKERDKDKDKDKDKEREKEKTEEKKTESPTKTPVKSDERAASKAKSTTSNKESKATEKKEKDKEVLSFDKIKVCVILWSDVKQFDKKKTTKKTLKNPKIPVEIYSNVILDIGILYKVSNEKNFLNSWEWLPGNVFWTQT